LLPVDRLGLVWWRDINVVVRQQRHDIGNRLYVEKVRQHLQLTTFGAVSRTFHHRVVRQNIHGPRRASNGYTMYNRTEFLSLTQAGLVGLHLNPAEQRFWEGGGATTACSNYCYRR